MIRNAYTRHGKINGKWFLNTSMLPNNELYSINFGLSVVCAIELHLYPYSQQYKPNNSCIMKWFYNFAIAALNIKRDLAKIENKKKTTKKYDNVVLAGGGYGFYFYRLWQKC